MSVHDTGAGRRGPQGRGNPRGPGNPRGRGHLRRGDVRRPLLPGSGPLARVPPVAVFAAVAVVFAVAVILGGVVGAILLGVLALGVVVLLAASWSRLSPGHRVGRVAILAVLVLVAVGVVTRGGLAG